MIRAVILTIVFAGAACADTPLPGVRFDIMPVGCRIHGAYSNGDATVRDYLGKLGDTYRVASYNGVAGTELVMTSTFNSNGFVIRNDFANGNWETFTPYSCLLQAGDCSFVSQTSDGRKRRFNGKVVQDGSTVTTTGGFDGEKPSPASVMTLGRFNTIENLSNGEITFSLTKYETCGTP